MSDEKSEVLRLRCNELIEDINSLGRIIYEHLDDLRRDVRGLYFEIQEKNDVESKDE